MDWNKENAKLRELAIASQRYSTALWRAKEALDKATKEINEKYAEVKQ